MFFKIIIKSFRFCLIKYIFLKALSYSKWLVSWQKINWLIKKNTLSKSGKKKQFLKYEYFVFEFVYDLKRIYCIRIFGFFAVNIKLFEDILDIFILCADIVCCCTSPNIYYIDMTVSFSAERPPDKLQEDFHMFSTFLTYITSAATVLLSFPRSLWCSLLRGMLISCLSCPTLSHEWLKLLMLLSACQSSSVTRGRIWYFTVYILHFQCIWEMTML